MIPAVGLLTIVGASSAVVVNHTSSPVAAQASAGNNGDLIAAALNDQKVSRNAERAPLLNEAEAEKMISGHMYVIETDAVDVYADADETSPVLAILAPGDKVAVTGEKQRRLDPDHAQGRAALGEVVRPHQGAGARRRAVP